MTQELNAFFQACPFPSPTTVNTAAESPTFSHALPDLCFQNKPYGIEIQDYRIGGVKQRIATCIETLESYINGTINCIPQLEEDILEFKGGSAKWMFTGMIGGNLL